MKRILLSLVDLVALAVIMGAAAVLALSFVRPAHAQSITLTVSATSILNGPQAEQDDLSVRFKETAVPPGALISYEITGAASCPNGASENILHDFSIPASKRGIVSNTVLVEEPTGCSGTPTYSAMQLCDRTNNVCVGF